MYVGLSGISESTLEKDATEHGPPRYLFVDLPAQYEGDKTARVVVFHLQAFSHVGEHHDYYCVRAARVGTIDQAPTDRTATVGGTREAFNSYRPAGKLEATQNAVQVTVHRDRWDEADKAEAKLGPIGTIMIRKEDTGIGLGSYLLSQVVSWLAEH